MKHLGIVLLLLALTAGLLTWAVVTGAGQRCFFAETIGTDRHGYVKVPCGLSFDELLAYLKKHPNLPLGPLPK